LAASVRDDDQRAAEPSARAASSGVRDVLRRVGFGLQEVERWATAASAPAADDLDRSLASLAELARATRSLVGRLPAGDRRSADERAAARGVRERLGEARARVARRLAAEIYERSRGSSPPSRLEELLARIASVAPPLLPERDELDADRVLPLRLKDGVERDGAEVVAAVLDVPGCGMEVVQTMRRPLPEAAERLPELARHGTVELRHACVRRDGTTTVVELRNADVLNAEDADTLADLELAVDLALLDEATQVGVLRGGRVRSLGYADRRVFSAGLNLTALAAGSLPYLFFPSRELGLVAKLQRGLRLDSGEVVEKPWIALVDAFAIGGGCQLALAVDHLVAEESAYFSLPASHEGLIPGAAPLRLARAVGDRLARRMLFSGEAIAAESEHGQLLVDEIAPPDALEAAGRRWASVLVRIGMQAVVANRRAFREANEPEDRFRAYAALYAREQAACMFSETLARNLEERWVARRAVAAEAVAR
jgi:(3,5-dihydroxyphenyl)acetyl-CoA 1,2-dioxygenase